MNIFSSLFKIREQPPHWRCFHCNEVFHSEEAAENHFGETPCAEPLCFEAQTEKERRQLQLIYRQERQIEALSNKIEGLEYLIEGQRTGYKAFGKESLTIHELFNTFSDMSFRIKVQEKIISACALKFGDEPIARIKADVAGEPGVDAYKLYTSI